MKNYVRAEILLETQTDVLEFTRKCSESNYRLIVEDDTGVFKVCADSILGMIYAASEFDRLYVASTQGDALPAFVDEYRPN